jgi:hypothetical protein
MNVTFATEKLADACAAASYKSDPEDRYEVVAVNGEYAVAVIIDGFFEGFL